MKFEIKRLKEDNKYILWVERWRLRLFVFALATLLILIGLFFLIRMGVNERVWVTPLPSGGVEEVEQSPEPSASVSAKRKRFWTGIASWYSREGCVGCSESLVMANGEPLMNDKLTVAFNKLPLGSTVEIRNMENDLVTTAKVTDRGGFEVLNRLVDITPAVRDAINCGGLCKVRVYEK